MKSESDHIVWSVSQLLDQSEINMAYGCVFSELTVDFEKINSIFEMPNGFRYFSKVYVC